MYKYLFFIVVLFLVLRIKVNLLSMSVWNRLICSECKGFFICLRVFVIGCINCVCIMLSGYFLSMVVIICFVLECCSVVSVVRSVLYFLSWFMGCGIDLFLDILFCSNVFIFLIVIFFVN